MKKVLLLSGLALGTLAYAQESFNKLSIDFGLGLNKSFSKFNTGRASSVNFPHIDLGARYMLTNKFGLYGGVGQEYYRSTHDVGNNGVRNMVDRVTSSFSLQFEGVISLTNILEINKFNPKLGLYMHAGPRFVSNAVEDITRDIKIGTRDNLIGFNTGLTAQYKVTSKLAIKGDASFVGFMMQQRSLDGSKIVNKSNGFDGGSAAVTLGVNYYIGKAAEHADWTPNNNGDAAAVAALKAKIEKAEKDMMDDDKDGVPNYLDQEAGTAADAKVNTKGITVVEEKVVDMDGDGVLDVNDFCPTIKGSASANGCPDSDGDGIYDFVDKCPNAAGLASDNGCPVVKAKDKEVMTRAMKGVQFDNAKATITKKSLPILDEVAKVLLSNASYNLEINGHTDNVGDAGKNLQLSDDRAKAVKAYLMSKGVGEARLKATGYGDTQPKTSNATAKGKAENRRVEFLIKFEQ